MKAMADIKIADVGQVTGLSTIVVMATQNRVQIPMDALASILIFFETEDGLCSILTSIAKKNQPNTYCSWF